MSKFFKRSTKSTSERRQENDACANDHDSNRSIEKLHRKRLAIGNESNENTSTSSIAVGTVGERVSNFFFNIMAKGKNRRNFGKNKSQSKTNRPIQNEKQHGKTELKPQCDQRSSIENETAEKNIAFASYDDSDEKENTLNQKIVAKMPSDIYHNDNNKSNNNNPYSDKNSALNVFEDKRAVVKDRSNAMHANEIDRVIYFDSVDDTANRNDNNRNNVATYNDRNTEYDEYICFDGDNEGVHATSVVKNNLIAKTTTTTTTAAMMTPLPPQQNSCIEIDRCSSAKAVGDLNIIYNQNNLIKSDQLKAANNNSAAEQYSCGISDCATSSADANNELETVQNDHCKRSNATRDYSHNNQQELIASFPLIGVVQSNRIETSVERQLPSVLLELEWLRISDDTETDSAADNFLIACNVNDTDNTTMGQQQSSATTAKQISTTNKNNATACDLNAIVREEPTQTQIRQQQNNNENNNYDFKSEIKTTKEYEDRIAANEIKDIFYEATSDSPNDHQSSSVSVATAKISIFRQRSSDHVADNIHLPFESTSNVKSVDNSKCDTSASCIDVGATTTESCRMGNVQNSINYNNIRRVEQTVDHPDGSSGKNNDGDIKISEKSPQMEQNLLYRVDSYNSDDAAEISDCEETIINENGKVVEVKTFFNQRPNVKANEIRQQNANNRTDSSGRGVGYYDRPCEVEIVEVADLSDELYQNISSETFLKCSGLRLPDIHEAENECEEQVLDIDQIEIIEQVEEEEEEEEEEDEEEEELDEEEEEELEEEEIEIEEEYEELSTESLTNDVTNGDSYLTSPPYANSNSNTDCSDIDLVNRNSGNQSAFNLNPIHRNDNCSNYSINRIDDRPAIRVADDHDGENVIRLLVNGQPTSFRNNNNNNNNHNKNISDTHIGNNSNSNSENKINTYSNSKPPKLIQNISRDEPSHPQNYPDDSMRLPDIVVESTAGNCVSNDSLTSSSYSITENSTTDIRNPPIITINDASSWNGSEDALIGDNIKQEVSMEKEKNNKMDQLNESLNEAKQSELKLLAQIKEANTHAVDCQLKISDLSYKINELERDLSVKSWNIDRLQAELDAAYKEGNCVKLKLKRQEADLTTLRAKLSEYEDEFNIRYNALEAEHTELQEKLNQMQKLAISLQVQLATAQCDASDLRTERERLMRERNDEKQALQDALDAAIIERAENDAKWQRDFEQLRTFNSDREELLLQDCEWKIRATERTCKDRVNKAEASKTEAMERSAKIESDAQVQFDRVKHLKTCEAEVAALRGLTGEQRESIRSLSMQLEEIKAKLDESTRQLEESTTKIRKMALQFASDLSDKDRETIAKIDEVRCDVATMWEDRLLTEMLRLKVELETCYAEDRVDAMRRAHEEHMADVNQLKESFSFREQLLRDEVESIKSKLADRNRRLDEANDKADKQIMQIRMILDKSERDHQREINSEILQHEEYIKNLQLEFEAKETSMKDNFESRLHEIQQKYAEDVDKCRNELIIKYKREYEAQHEKLKQEKEEEQEDLKRTYKRKLIDAEVKIRDIEILHQREVKDLQNAHSMERSSLDQRDLQNSHEIETLHRKCRCLTKLFEEMRIRYERRDPRAEDVREINELKSVIDEQDKDLRKLTEQLREMQMCRSFENKNGVNSLNNDHESVAPKVQAPQAMRKMKKPKINCDVIYEDENEEQETQPISA